jgi:hypothetical protein
MMVQRTKLTTFYPTTGLNKNHTIAFTKVFHVVNISTQHNVTADYMESDELCG